MKTWHRILVVVALVVMGTAATAQVVPPQIGVYFDAAGTTTEYPVGGPGEFVTAYIMATGGQFYMGGTSFALDVAPGINIIASNLAVGGVEIPSNPDLTAGVELGFYDPVFVDDGHPLVLYTLVLTVDERPMGDLPITVVAHPNYDNVVVAQNDGALFDTTGGTGFITPPPPVLGVYWDQAATITSATYNGGVGEVYTAYVMVTGGPILLGGASFRLSLDPNITLVTAQPVPSVALGDVFNGIEIGLYDPVFVDPDHPGLVMTLVMTTMNNLVDNAPICVINHPDYDSVMLAESDGTLVPAEGGCAFLTVPVENENRSWTDVKALFK